MSYDFRLFPCTLSEPPALNQPGDEKKARFIRGRERLVAKFEERMPQLRRSSKLRLSITATAEEGDRNNRHESIELTDSVSGLQVRLFQDSISVTIPYRADSDVQKDLVHQLWECLRLFEAAGFSSFDVQQDKVLSLDADYEGTQSYYTAVCDKISRVLPGFGDRV